MKYKIHMLAACWHRKHHMRVALWVSTLVACHLSLANEQLTPEMVDELLQVKRQNAIENKQMQQKIHMVLHDIPCSGCISTRLEWSIANGVGTTTITSWPAASKAEGVAFRASLNSAESKKIMCIATNLLQNVKSDAYRGWTGPLFGLDFRLDDPTGTGTLAWRKWSTSTNILSSTHLKGYVQHLRDVASNAVARAQERAVDDGEDWTTSGASEPLMMDYSTGR